MARFAVCLAVALSACVVTGHHVAAQRTRPPVDAAILAASPTRSASSMDSIVRGELLPQLEAIFDNLVANGPSTQLHGVSAFASTNRDRFLPGKIAIGLSHLLLQTPRSDPKFQLYLNGYRRIMDFTIDTSNESWGIYYYTSALWKLKKAGLLEAAVSPATLAKLRLKLDWRTFVSAADYSLINLPTNYYGVAFSIARLRVLLGWEGPEASDAMLQKVIGHYKAFSTFGFSDETDGSGRFDRYSVLLIGEICQRLIETGLQASDADMALLKGWLRQSVDLVTLRLNPAGNGFDFGRSLSAYGDTAFAEVLSAAAHLDVLSADEKELAYAFATRVTAKYVEFWYDADMKSVNLWEKGRRTDAYRGKGRILGENLSLAHQLIYTNDLWKADGYATRPPMSADRFVAALTKLPRATLTRFAGFDRRPGTHDRGLVTYRDAHRVFSLPMVNGAATYHRTNSYFAIPYSYNLISGVADAQWPQLLPRLTTGNEQPLIQAAWFRNIQIHTSGSVTTVSYSTDALDQTTAVDPIRDTRFTSTTQYRFEPGRVARTDVYAPTATPQALTKIELEFGTFSTHATQKGTRFSFARGDVTGFEVEGLDRCLVVNVSADADYNTPTGPLETSIRCSTGAITLTRPIRIRWVLRYRSPSVGSFVPR